ncbi:cAMP-specific 3', partial [Nibea albiflora]
CPSSSFHTLCYFTESTTTKPAVKATTAALQTGNDVSTSKTTATHTTQKLPATTHQSTSEVTSVSSSPPPPTSPQTSNRTEETRPTTTAQTIPANKTDSSEATVTPASESPNVTVTTNINATNPVSQEWEKDLAANPGLVAILCIFCIVLILMLVVVIVRCARSPRSNFERLEDVPLGRRESLPVVNQAVRRRYSGQLMLPPLWRRHSCQDPTLDTRRASTAQALPLDRLEVLYSRALASHDEHRREGAGLAKPPKHLWRQPRTHIRIKQRFNSDTERYLCRNRTLEKLRPGLKKPRMSWPSSLKR